MLIHLKNIHLEPSEKETSWNVNMEEIKGVNTERVCPNQLCSILEYKKECIAVTYPVLLFKELPLDCHSIALHMRAHTHTHIFTHIHTHTEEVTMMYTFTLFVSSTDYLLCQLCCQQPACRRGRYAVRTNVIAPLL